jgi:protein TonB
MIRRYATAVVLGGLVTLAVLFTMQVLIATAKGRLDESGRRHFVDFVRVAREEVFQRKDRKPDKPLAPTAPPPEAVEPRVDSIDPAQVAAGVPVAPTEVDVAVSIEGLGLVASDGDYLPIVKIAPAYPMIARTRGIEGYCIVEYTVTSAGTTKDVVVIEADPKGVFNKVSIEAALKFKYRPRVVNGEPIEVRGVRNIFRYQLESR